jgi:mannose-1-phosphate guanylyltransferase
MAGGRTLLALTLERIGPLFDSDRTIIVTQERQVDATERVARRFAGVRILAEPVGKNTAACIAYSASWIVAGHGDGLMAVMPADHFIEECETFRKVMAAAMDFADSSGGLVTLGIRPDRPATGFGYLQVGDRVETSDGMAFHKVERFAEKPSAKQAEAYIESGQYLWNAGIFVFKASSILAEIDHHLPDVGERFRRCRDSIGTRTERDCIAAVYADVRDISIDYGVMEKTDRAYVVPAEIGWDDVGSWDSFARHMATDAAGNAVHGTHLSVDTTDCVVYSDGPMVATSGIRGLTIVATDDAILVTRKGCGEGVKELVDRIEDEGLTEVL